MLNAEWLSAAPSVWASDETSISRICRPVGRMSALPSRKMVIIAVTGVLEVTANAAKTRAMSANPPYIAGIGRQSISRPPTTLPQTIPRPQTASATGTRAVASPARSVRIGEM
jgi:hypothetical protein